MSVPTKDRPSGDGVPQKNLWGLKAELTFRRLLADIMKCSRKPRAQIARELSEILGRPADRPVGKNLLDDCVRSRKQGRMIRFPAAWIPALCQVTGSDRLQRHLLSERLLGFLTIGEDVTEAAESLKRAQEAVAKMVEQGRGRKAEKKRIRKT